MTGGRVGCGCMFQGRTGTFCIAHRIQPTVPNRDGMTLDLLPDTLRGFTGHEHYEGTNEKPASRRVSRMHGTARPVT